MRVRDHRDSSALLGALGLGVLALSQCSSPRLEHAVEADADARVPTRDASEPDAGGDAPGGVVGAIRYVFVIAMENADAATIYGAGMAWPYLGRVLSEGARALTFEDELPRGTRSEPHYVWMEAGTNVFADHTFTNDDPPSASNSTGTSDHLVAQLARAANGADWMSYQEGLDANTGACPLVGAGFYRPRHDPFVFFRDVVGSPPSSDAPVCVAHHKPIAALADDLAAATVKTYSFITPNLCHDAHGQPACPADDLLRGADGWLSATLPALISFVNEHQGAIFIVWDEGSSTSLLPFIAIGPHVKPGYASTVAYSHSSLLKSLEEILRVPVLPTVTSANDFADLFEGRFFP